MRRALIKPTVPGALLLVAFCASTAACGNTASTPATAHPDATTVVPTDTGTDANAPMDGGMDASMAVDAGVDVQALTDVAMDASADALVDVPVDVPVDAPTDVNAIVPAGCDPLLPTTLSCTGLYADIATRTVAPGIASFAPAIQLWSDGAGKSRWIYLPPGTTIDRTDPNDWVFPVGTRFWKEFAFNGVPIETRMFHKTAAGTWQWVSYIWNAGLTEATSAPMGMTVPIGDGGTWAVPSQTQCHQCHGGRPEPVMGFEEVSLGTAGAAGLTLAQLAAAGLLSPTPTRTSLVIGDDGTGLAAHALGWIHINCGVSCHNTISTSAAFPEGMHLRLDATLLDGRSSATFGPEVTTENVHAVSINWPGQIRIVPGEPDQSLLISLVSSREPGNQMPPLGTTVVDSADVAILRAWVTQMAGGGADGGVVDAGAGADGTVTTDATAGPD